MATVKVYYFKCYDGKTDKEPIMERMATLDAIKGFGDKCTPLMDTAKEVDTSEIDHNGRYPIQRPI